MAAFQSWYNKDYNPEIKNPHRLMPFKDEWEQFLTGKTVDFLEFCYTGNKDNATVYFMPDDGQVDFFDSSKKPQPITTPCYISFAGDNSLVKASRLLLTTFLESDIHYACGSFPFSLALFLKEKGNISPDEVKAILKASNSAKGKLRLLSLEQLPEEEWQLKDIKLIEGKTGKSGYVNNAQKEYDKIIDKLRVLQELTTTSSPVEVADFLSAPENAVMSRKVLAIYGLMIGSDYGFIHAEALIPPKE
jgi:hypothetical protein